MLIPRDSASNQVIPVSIVCFVITVTKNRPWGRWNATEKKKKIVVLIPPCDSTSNQHRRYRSISPHDSLLTPTHNYWPQRLSSHQCEMSIKKGRNVSVDTPNEMIIRARSVMPLVSHSWLPVAATYRLVETWNNLLHVKKYRRNTYYPAVTISHIECQTKFNLRPHSETQMRHDPILTTKVTAVSK